MRKALAVLLFVACARHETGGRTPSAPTGTGARRAPSNRVVVPKPRGVSTPAKCAGDGSYEQAVECLRMSSGFHFHVTSPSLTGRGALERPRPGQEHVTLGDWSAEAKPGGIVWTRGGKPAKPAPELERLYQRLTLWLDPQKKEGTPQLVDGAGKTNRYHFTDANSGEAYDVVVAKDDGRMVDVHVGKTEISIQ